jgi:hypothetical protein
VLKVLAFSERKELLDELLSFLNQRADEVDVICREGFDPSGFNVKNVYYLQQIFMIHGKLLTQYQIFFQMVTIIFLWEHQQ